MCEVSSVKSFYVKCHLSRALCSLLACLIIGLALEGCLPLATPTPLVLPSDTPRPPTETPAPTPVWFPPTATFTLFPTPEILPTEDMRPGIGALLFQDDFSDPTAWLLSQTEAGSMALGKDELSIVILQERTYLFSVRQQPVFSDFYLEITASTSFCRAKDEYGLLLRVSPDLAYYRFSLSCDGYVRLDRAVEGRSSSPQPWMLSGAAPPGAPSQVRLGVWAVGDEMRFFVNDYYQFTVHDPVLWSGGLGVFARSASAEQVTVNFSDLQVYEIVDDGN